MCHDSPASDVVFESSTTWLVWKRTGRQPVAKHASAEAAIAEAKRLARLNPGQKFRVLGQTGKYHVPLVAQVQPQTELEPA